MFKPFKYLKHLETSEICKDVPKVPEELVLLIKDLLPLYMHIGLLTYRKDQPGYTESEMVRNRCSAIRARIFQIEFIGEFIMNVNGFPFIVKIFWDKELERKQIDIDPTESFELNFKWE